MKRLLLTATACLLLLTGCNTQAEKNKEASKMKESTEESLSSSSKEASSASSENSQHYDPGALLSAVSENNLTLVESILKDKTYAINEQNDQGETPLLIAAHQNFVPIAKVLIDHGADINLQDHISDSAFLYAGAQGKTEILQYMLTNSEPDFTKYNRFGGNALIPAAEKGHLENVKLLLEDGRTPVDFQNDFGYTALIEAVALTDGSEVYQQIIQELLAKGANKQLRDNYGMTAEAYATKLGYTKMSEILASYP